MEAIRTYCKQGAWMSVQCLTIAALCAIACLLFVKIGQTTYVLAARMTGAQAQQTADVSDQRLGPGVAK